MPFERHLGVVDNQTKPAKLKIAFASSDHQHVDQHFGHSHSFVIYSIDEQHHAHLLELVTFDGHAKTVQAPTQQHDNNKLMRKLVTLDDCDAVYCIACGPSAIRQLLEQSIQPVKVDIGTPIKYLLHHLIEQMQQPSGWLARALRKQHKTNQPPWQSDDYY